MLKVGSRYSKVSVDKEAGTWTGAYHRGGLVNRTYRPPTNIPVRAGAAPMKNTLARRAGRAIAKHPLAAVGVTAVGAATVGDRFKRQSYPSEAA